MARTKSVSRAKEQSAIAAAAYRAGDKLLNEDKDHGRLHDYEKRSGILNQPPRLYRRVIYLSQAASSDRIK